MQVANKTYFYFTVLRSTGPWKLLGRCKTKLFNRTVKTHRSFQRQMFGFSSTAFSTAYVRVQNSLRDWKTIFLFALYKIEYLAKVTIVYVTINEFNRKISVSISWRIYLGEMTKYWYTIDKIKIESIIFGYPHWVKTIRIMHSAHDTRFVRVNCKSFCCKISCCCCWLLPFTPHTPQCILSFYFGNRCHRIANQATSLLQLPY